MLCFLLVLYFQYLIIKPIYHTRSFQNLLLFHEHIYYTIVKLMLHYYRIFQREKIILNYKIFQLYLTKVFQKVSIRIINVIYTTHAKSYF